MDFLFAVFLGLSLVGVFFLAGLFLLTGFFGVVFFFDTDTLIFFFFLATGLFFATSAPFVVSAFFCSSPECSVLEFQIRHEKTYKKRNLTGLN